MDGSEITAALRDAVGMDVNVLIRTAAEMAAVVKANPYPVDDPTKVVVTFLAGQADAEALAGFDVAAFAPEHLTVHGTEVYLHLPSGQGRSKLTAALAKVKTPGAAWSTTRNWRTVEALAELAGR